MAILFDLDGTLFDTSRDIHAAVNQVLQSIDKPLMDLDELRKSISFGTKVILSRALSLDPAADAAYLDPLVTRGLDFYLQTGFTQTFAFPGIEELLTKLEQANIPWGIVTNKTEALTMPFLSMTGHLQRAACIVCGDTTSHSKPHPEPLLHACRLIDIAPEKCVYIGDAATDIQAGKAAGMRTIAAAFGFVPDPAAVPSWQADHIVQTPHEIFPWIEAWSKDSL
jgi:2-phosphoglycolate phosphatase